MDVQPTSLADCLLLRPSVIRDRRGSFVKPFQESTFAASGLPTRFPERFYSTSHRGVVRGLHLQLPPRAQHKLVYCPWGRVLDAVVDLRVGSPTAGKWETFELDSDQWNAVLIPAGLAHGFACLSEVAVMAYAVSEEYDPRLDTGIRWDSAGIPWPFTEPLLSSRDAALPPLETFPSPFRFAGSGG